MTYINAVKYVLSLPRGAANLDRARHVADQLCPEYKQLPVVHICGNENKTSCRRMLVSILKKQGYTVGGYSEDPCQDMRQIITVNEEPLTYDMFAQVVTTVNAAYAKLEVTPTSSEVFAVCAMLCYVKCGCNIAVLEKDYDKNAVANIAAYPTVSIITSIDSPILGELDLDSALRRGTRETVTAPQHKDVYNSISEGCAAIGSRLTLPIYSELEIKKIGLFKTTFSYEGNDYSLRSFSHDQMINAITMIEVARALEREGFTVSKESLASGISAATFPYFCETLSVDPTIIACTANNGKISESLFASIAQVKALINGEIVLCVEGASPSDGNQIRNSLADRNIKTDRVINIPRGLTHSKLNQAVKSIPNSLSDGDALIIIGNREFIISTSDALKKMMGKI